MDDNHKEIWLSPVCEGERTWCQDKEAQEACDCGHKPVHYIRADLHDAEIQSLRGQLATAQVDAERVRTNALKEAAEICDDLQKRLNEKIEKYGSGNFLTVESPAYCKTAIEALAAKGVGS